MTDKTEAPELKPYNPETGVPEYDAGFVDGMLKMRDMIGTDACAEVKPFTREGVIDRIEQIVSDTHDVDTTDRHYAENVFDECIDCISVAIRQEIEHARKEGYAQALEDAAKEAERPIEWGDDTNWNYQQTYEAGQSDAAENIRALSKEQGE